jgi:hypothetical protein
MTVMFRGCMLIIVEDGGDVAWHGQVQGVFWRVPVQGKATVECALPVTGGFIVLFQSVVQVLGMGFANILYTKVFNNQQEQERCVWCFPQAVRVSSWSIAMDGQPFWKEFAGEDCGRPYMPF